MATTTFRDTALPELDPFDSDLVPPPPTRLRPAYGFDDVAIVPGVETIHPDDVDLSWELAGHRFSIPFIASAMDGVVDVPFAVALGRLGGLAVLNLEGLQTRYERPEEPLAELPMHLTKRELEIAQLIRHGRSNKEMAGALGLSEHTVKTHVRRIMEKLALHSRLQIATYAHGGFSLPPDGVHPTN